MTNTLNALTGIDGSSNTSAKRKRARPLLVVHSGNTTIGPVASLRMLFRGLASPARPLNGGTCPVMQSISRSDTVWKPWIGTRAAGERVAEDEMAAEPVPVRRPGALALDVLMRERYWSIGAGFGRTNTGLNLPENEDIDATARKRRPTGKTTIELPPMMSSLTR